MIWTLKVLSTIIQPIPTSSCKTPNQPPLPVTQAQTASTQSKIPKKSTKNHVTTINLHMKDFSIKGTIATQYLNLGSVLLDFQLSIRVQWSRYESIPHFLRWKGGDSINGFQILWGHHDLPPPLSQQTPTQNGEKLTISTWTLGFISENVQKNKSATLTQEFKTSKGRKAPYLDVPGI